MKMKSSILAILILFSGTLLAQKESFSFQSLSHNFGTIEEEAGYATHEFQFTNTGTTPIKITGVKASCGCTTPSWSKEEIAPGETGHVSARYNPKNRPGKFNKTLTVTTGNNDKIFLKITGNVLKAPLPPDKQFPYASGHLRFKSEQINAGAIMHDEVKEFNLEIYNSTDSALLVQELIQLPAHMSLKDPQARIAAKNFANVIILIDAGKSNDWGLRVDDLSFTALGQPSKLQIRSEIRENFDHLTPEEKAAAPKITLSKTALNLGDIPKGKKMKSTVVYTNNGQSDLIIRKISSTCGCTVWKSQKDVIKPGKSGKLLITLHTDKEDYNQNNIITLICNDPKAPVHTIQVRANIVE